MALRDSYLFISPGYEWHSFDKGSTLPVDKRHNLPYNTYKGNPNALLVQNVDTLEEGARAAADVFRKYGFEAYAGSRLD